MKLVSTVRYAWRSLSRTPGLTAMAMLCMGLGIGLCATLFSTVNPWLFRPLPYAEPDRLLSLREKLPREAEGVERTSEVSGPNYLDWVAQGRSFEAGAFERTEFNLATRDEPERISAARIAAGLFPLLGKPTLSVRGRGPEEDQPGGRPVAIVGHALWQRRLSGDAWPWDRS